MAEASSDEDGLSHNGQRWGTVGGQQQRESGQGQPLPEPLGSQEWLALVHMAGPGPAGSRTILSSFLSSVLI